MPSPYSDYTPIVEIPEFDLTRINMTTNNNLNIQSDQFIFINNHTSSNQFNNYIRVKLLINNQEVYHTIINNTF